MTPDITERHRVGLQVQQLNDTPAQRIHERRRELRETQDELESDACAVAHIRVSADLIAGQPAFSA